MPRTIGEIEKENNKTVGKNIKQFSRDWYQTKEWRDARERYRKKKRAEHEKIVMDVYNNNIEENGPDDLYAFLTDDRRNPLSELSLKQGKIRVADMVDHIHPIQLGGSKTQFSNLQWLTNEEHYEKTRKELEKERNG